MRCHLGVGILLLLVFVFGSGCASIVSDNDSTTYFETVPEQARCELHGQDFVRVVNTPTSIALPSEAAPITVACKAEGYKTTTEELDTKMDGWIIGNLVFGGIIGGVVDAARGAGSKYPTKISLHLQPEMFSSEQKRDQWFDARVAAINAKWDAAIARESKKCTSDNKYSRQRCEKKVAEAESAKADAVADLELERGMAVVASAGQPAAQLTPAPEAGAEAEAAAEAKVDAGDAGEVGTGGS